MTQQTSFSDLPKHEMLRAVGQTTVQAGLFMIAVSTVLKQLGNLPDSPVITTIFTEKPTQSNFEQPKNTNGYFD